jgi:ferredoxin
LIDHKRGYETEGGMSVKISEVCIRCGACEWECPNEAISPGQLRPSVNPDRCTECFGHFGECQCAVVCPVGAIKIELCESKDVLEERFRRLHPAFELYNTEIWERTLS